jgi:hypothetical protein
VGFVVDVAQRVATTVVARFVAAIAPAVVCVLRAVDADVKPLPRGFTASGFPMRGPEMPISCVSVFEVAVIDKGSSSCLFASVQSLVGTPLITPARYSLPKRLVGPLYANSPFESIFRDFDGSLSVAKGKEFLFGRTLSMMQCFRPVVVGGTVVVQVPHGLDARDEEASV